MALSSMYKSPAGFPKNKLWNLTPQLSSWTSVKPLHLREASLKLFLDVPIPRAV